MYGACSLCTLSPSPYYPDSLLLKWHGKEQRCGSGDSGVKPIKPSTVTSHDGLVEVSAGAGTLLSVHQYGPPCGCSRSIIQILQIIYPVHSFIHTQQKITRDCRPIFLLKAGRKTEFFLESSLCTEKLRLFPCLNLISRKSREKRKHYSHLWATDVLTALVILMRACQWGYTIFPWPRKQGPLSGTAGGPGGLRLWKAAVCQREQRAFTAVSENAWIGKESESSVRKCRE